MGNKRIKKPPRYCTPLAERETKKRKKEEKRPPVINSLSPKIMITRDGACMACRSDQANRKLEPRHMCFARFCWVNCACLPVFRQHQKHCARVDSLLFPQLLFQVFVDLFILVVSFVGCHIGFLSDEAVRFGLSMKSATFSPFQNILSGGLFSLFFFFQTCIPVRMKDTDFSFLRLTLSLSPCYCVCRMARRSSRGLHIAFTRVHFLDFTTCAVHGNVPKLTWDLEPAVLSIPIA